MSRAFEFFSEYVKVETTASDSSGMHPSSPGQLDLGRRLVSQLQELGVSDAAISCHGYVMGHLAPSPGCEHIPALGLIAHMDTAAEASGKDVKISVVDYAGGSIPLGTSGLAVTPGERFAGHRLAVTDGTTLLGADDKAGIAAVMAMLDEIRARKIPHGKLCICFTPDEEIGEGTLFFDVPAFGAEYAFTVDGGNPEEVEFQNFNAAGAEVVFKGISCHPGYAKGIMINAARVAMEFDAMLPTDEVPEKTSGFEGFFHLLDMSGNVSRAELQYIIRDHDAGIFAARKACMTRVAAELNRKYGEGTVQLTITDQYRNMEEKVADCPELLALADEAVRRAGMTPVHPPIRGGTDGSKLSFMGLPCPNLGTGGHLAHGEMEFLSLDEQEKVVQILLNLVALCCEEKRDF